MCDGLKSLENSGYCLYADHIVVYVRFETVIGNYKCHPLLDDLDDVP